MHTLKKSESSKNKFSGLEIHHVDRNNNVGADVLSKLGSTRAAVVRPGAARLLKGIECSRVTDSSWMYLTSFVTTRIGVELVAVQGNYPIVL